MGLYLSCVTSPQPAIAERQPQQRGIRPNLQKRLGRGGEHPVGQLTAERRIMA